MVSGVRASTLGEFRGGIHLITHREIADACADFGDITAQNCRQRQLRIHRTFVHERIHRIRTRRMHPRKAVAPESPFRCRGQYDPRGGRCRSSRLRIAGSGAVGEQLQYSKEGAAIGGGNLGQ